MYNAPVLTVDKEKLKSLKMVYDYAMESISAGLPNLNLESRKDVLTFFDKTFNIELKSVKIAEIALHIYGYGENSEERDIIQGIVYYFKLKYALKNYINPMIKSAPRIQLSVRFGRVEMNNHQPLPKSPEILDCITGAEHGVLLEMVKGEKTIVIDNTRGEIDE